MIVRVVKIVLWICLLSVCRVSAAQDMVIQTRGDVKLKSLGVDTVKVMDAERSKFFEVLRQQAEMQASRRSHNAMEVNASLQLAQTQFENWASGGDNTFSGRARFQLKHRYKRAVFSFETLLEARYGLTYVDGESYKNEDEFRINLISSWALSPSWSYAMGVNLRSQFATGYKSRSDRTRRSTFMAPGYLDISAGFKYSKNSIFSMTLSPISGNAVFMLDDALSLQGLNGVEEGRKAHWSVGPSARLLLDLEFVKSVFRLRSDLFSFCNLKKPPTVRWETSLDIRATKFISTTIAALIYYDKEADTPRFNSLQYKYSFSVGLSYTFKK